MPRILQRCRGLLLLAPWLAGQIEAADFPMVTWQGETMGSVYTVKVVGASLSEAQTDRIKAQIDTRLKDINGQLSHYLPDSELSRFNHAPVGERFRISAGFAEVLRASLELHRQSHGAFDPTLGPVVNLWGFGESGTPRRIPPESEIGAALRKTGCEGLMLSTNNDLRKTKEGLQLNFSAIAKGYGADEMGRVLRANRLTNYYVSISGEVCVSGYNAQGGKWKVGVSAPLLDWRPGDPIAAVLALSGQAVSTSGDYQKYSQDDQGRRWCHILDPKTGHPVQHRLASVSVVADCGMMADALSTTLFVLGPEEGRRFIESRTNAAALFIVRTKEGDFRQSASSRFTAMTGYRP